MKNLNPAQRREKAEQDWMTVSSDLVTAWCKRFQAMARAKEKAVAESGNLAADVDAQAARRIRAGQPTPG